MKVGKKGRAWNKTRALLKKQFENQGIRFCEMCGSTFNLSFGHSRKRRFITTEEMLREVILICIPCHQQIEILPHADMFEIVTEIINKRD